MEKVLLDDQRDGVLLTLASVTCVLVYLGEQGFATIDTISCFHTDCPCCLLGQNVHS